MPAIISNLLELNLYYSFRWYKNYFRSCWTKNIFLNRRDCSEVPCISPKSKGLEKEGVEHIIVSI
jgi:hypothetical protein